MPVSRDHRERGAVDVEGAGGEKAGVVRPGGGGDTVLVEIEGADAAAGLWMSVNTAGEGAGAKGGLTATSHIRADLSCEHVRRRLSSGLQAT